MGAGRAAAAGNQHFPDGFGGAGDQRLNAAITPVADPAADVLAQGFALKEGAETHALYLPREAQVKNAVLLHLGQLLCRWLNGG